MPILQNNLVMKSIEALHDEAVALMTDTTVATPSQESRINMLEDRSEDASRETTEDCDIMARIDHLLKKLDEDDHVPIAPPPGKEAQLKTENMMSDTGEDMVSDVHKVESATPDQTQALANIAEAIYQARQQEVATVAADSSQNNAQPSYVDVLSTTVADEVRRTVLAVMITELPQVVRKAVDDAIRALPVNKPDLATQAIGNPSAAKIVTARKNTAAKKTGNKKTKTKKNAAKKASGKTKSKKISVRKNTAEKATPPAHSAN